MKKTASMVIAFAVLLFAQVTQALPTSQQSCDSTRITAWRLFVSCVEGVIAKDAKGVFFDEFAAFARCRHAYFKKWTAFQAKASLAGSACIGPRFTDNGDQTVTDNLSRLVWEKKDVSGGVHDAGNNYSWSTGGPYVENGTAFTELLGMLNSGAGFAGANGWRLPTLAELQTIVMDFACSGAGYGPTCFCPSYPCIDPIFSYTVSGDYWSATNYVPDPIGAWYVYFFNASVLPWAKADSRLARAVRGGL